VQLLLLTEQAATRLLGEMRRRLLALTLRGLAMRSRFRVYQSLGQSLGAILIRAQARGDMMSMAVRCRGGGGVPRTLRVFRAGWRDVGLAVAMAAVAAVVLGCDWSGA
jgi:energy-coupling factor transporter transmembrane protein EcfT